MSNMSPSERTCDYPGCAAPTTVQDVFGDHFCAADHLTAARNEWDAFDLERFEVEYDGVSGMYRAPSQQQADTQWKAIVQVDAHTARLSQSASAVERENIDSNLPALTDIGTVSARIASHLYDAGFEAVEDVATASESVLTDVDGIGERQAEVITNRASTLHNERDEMIANPVGGDD